MSSLALMWQSPRGDRRVLREGAVSSPRAVGLAFLVSFAAVAVGLGAARAATTSYVPLLLEQIADRPGLIGVAMLSNAVAGFFVPIVAGGWADRHSSRRIPIVAGIALSAGGLVAIALGTGTTYLVLGLAAGLVYVGLNLVHTLHRALVPERFVGAQHAHVVSAQEIAQLVGALAGTVLGGLLVLAAPRALFVVLALIAVLAALPTLRLAAVRETAAAAPEGAPSPRAVGLLAALRQPGARELLVAQGLWVAAYAGLIPFFALYADDVLGLSPGAAGGVLAGFGVLTGAGMLLAARVEPGRVRPALALGAAALGLGLSLAAAGASLAAVAAPFALAAVGAGVASALGFVYFSHFIPKGEAGRYSGAFLAMRALAAAIALPATGLIVSVTGSYRSMLGMGSLALAAVVPILLADRGSESRARRTPIGTLAAVIPVYRSRRFDEVALAAGRHAERVILVNDGAPPAIAARLDSLVLEHGFELIDLHRNHGKGTALAAGIDAALGRGTPPDAVLVMDSDCQHPPARIPALLEAAVDADVVIGDRSGERRRMPLLRRLANACSSFGISLLTRRRLPDSQNGMRLLRAEALRRVPFPEGRYESESRHLRELARARMEIAWVEIPAIYNQEPSDFRPVADTLRVARAILSPSRVAEPLAGVSALLGYVRGVSPRVLAALLLAIGLGMVIPALQPLDEQLFLSINAWGDGPDWLYQALDPHSRNYVALTGLAVLCSLLARRRPRYVFGAAAAVVSAAFLADLLLEIVQLSVNRPRPEEALGATTQLANGRSWAHLPSFPSGHMVVTAAMVAAAASALPKLRVPFLVYLAAIAITRVTFGAHFPLDVAAGALLGWEVGIFTAGATATAGLLPAAGRARRLPTLRRWTQPAIAERARG